MTKVVTSMSKFFKYFKKTDNIKMSVVLKWILNGPFLNELVEDVFWIFPKMKSFWIVH